MSAADPRIARTGLSVPDDAMRALKAGGLVLLGSRQGQPGRERSILFGVAAMMTDATVVQMVNHGRGLVSIAVDVDTAFRLGLRRMAGTGAGIPENGEYLVSIEAADCSGTGISARDRAATLRAAGGRDATQDDLVMPGHIMPLLVPGRLTRGSALPTVAHAIVMRSVAYSVVAWCDVLSRDGDVAGLHEASALARELQFPMVIADDVSMFTDSPGLSRAS